MKPRELHAQGGPAFPTHQLEWDFGTDDRELATKHPGMTLRDYFAAKALQGCLASGRVSMGQDKDRGAASCYEWADAMLRARLE